MDKAETIMLYKGATSVMDLDLTEFDFQGGTVVFTMKDTKTDAIIIQKEFDTPAIHQIIFRDDDTAGFKIGSNNYRYDIMWHLHGERYPQCEPSNVYVYDTVGGLDA